MKVFVAGHNGLVGSSLLRNSPNGVTIITASKQDLDLTDKVAIRTFLSQNRVDTVVLAAAKVGGIEANRTHQRDFLLTNLEIQNAVISVAAEVEVPNFVFLGSSCIYPKFAEQPISEDSLLTGTLEPTNEGYAIAKIAGIRLCKAIRDELGLNYFSLMPTNLYGPNDNYDLSSSHVPAALLRRFHEAKIENSESVQVWGTGTVKREFMHSDDMAQAIWHMLERKPEESLMNVGTGMDITIKEFAYNIAKVVGFEGDIVFDESKPDGTPRKLLDVAKIHSYGWRHKIELEEGLQKTYAWYVDALIKGEIRGL